MMLKPMLGAMALAMVTIAVAVLLPDPKALVLAAVVLGFVAGVYVGFGLADGRSYEAGIEIGVALLFLAVAALGLWTSPFMVAGGFIAHGLWDFLHHPRRVATLVTPWYPPACALYDMMVGVYVMLRWMR